MRVIHLCVVRQLTPGQLAQLRMERDAASELEGDYFETLAYHDGPPLSDFVRTTPPPFRSLFLRKLWSWIVVWQLSHKFDYVIVRHVTFDPFALICSWFVTNFVSMHHAKAEEELRLVRGGWAGAASSWLERFTAPIVTRNARAVLAVTEEIAEYVCDRYGVQKATGVYSNGVRLEDIPLLDDRREANHVNFGFLCGSFNRWHGLDKLISAVDRAPSGDVDNITIHLIGRLSPAQLIDIRKSSVRRRVFKCHGVLAPEAYREVLAVCNAGIGSLAMERQNLREGSTLKNREMLAMGLSVYSGHFDVAFPPGERFTKVVKEPSVVDMVAFGRAVKCYTREYVRQASCRNIDKKSAMLKAIEFLRSLT